MSMPGTAAQKLKERLDFVDLKEPEKRSLAALAPTIKASLNGALDAFYAKAKAHPETARFFSNDAHIAHAKGRQIGHWETIAQAKFDTEYVDAVSTVGRTHARLGLEPRWYIGGYALMIDGIVRAVIADELKGYLHRKKGKKLADDISVVVKAALVDMDYAISVYLEVLAAERQKSEDERLALKADQDNALQALGASLVKLSDGDLTAKLDVELAPNFATLKADYNGSVSSLNQAMQQIGDSVGNVSSQSSEIATATNDMAKRTEKQAVALEEAAAALEEISTISKQAEIRTAEIQGVITRSAGEAAKSGEVVEQAVKAMSDIEESSQRMTQIIGTIDEIAFQTNLLALNAGVEAARAGEQGKGFAVVAQEVRELAQRSANAAKEIKVLISRSSDDVARGVVLVHTTGKALRDIGEQVQQIDGFMSLIATSAQEQASGINAITSAVTNLDQITQQNAAMAEESSASTAKLSAEAAGLAELVSGFKLESGSQRHKPALVDRATSVSRPSPARQLVGTLKRAVSGQNGAKQSWEEF
jgi:methyl-accepting chemotaxis protein